MARISVQTIQRKKKKKTSAECEETTVLTLLSKTSMCRVTEMSAEVSILTS